jgi:hypothetical protein
MVDRTHRRSLLVVTATFVCAAMLLAVVAPPWGSGVTVSWADPPTDTPTPTYGPTATPRAGGTPVPTDVSRQFRVLSLTFEPPTMVTPLQTPVYTPTP